jgi:hypothetical protein
VVPKLGNEQSVIRDLVDDSVLFVRRKPYAKGFDNRLQVTAFPQLCGSKPAHEPGVMWQVFKKLG